MLNSFLKFARVRIVVTCLAIAFLGSSAVGAINLKTLLAFFVIVAWLVHGNSVNDISDQEIDKVNLKNAGDRPLVTKGVSLKRVWIIHFLSGILALVFSFLYGIGAVIFTIWALFLNYIYSLKPIRLTDRTFLSPLVLSLGYVYYPLSLGYWASNVNSKFPWILSIGLSFAFIARLLLKDFRDVKGDKQYGKITFLLRFGTKTTCIVSGVFWFIGAVMVSYATSFAPGVIITLVLGLVQVFILLQTLTKTPKLDQQQNIIVFIAKAANITIITILAFLLCQSQTNISKLEIELIPATIGSILLLFNFLKYRKIL